MSPSSPPRSPFPPREGPKDASSPSPGGLETPSKPPTPPCPLPGAAPAGSDVALAELEDALDAAWALSGCEAVWATLMARFEETGCAVYVRCPEHAWFTRRGITMDRHWCPTCGRPASDTGAALKTDTARRGLFYAKEGRDLLQRRIHDHPSSPRILR